MDASRLLMIAVLLVAAVDADAGTAAADVAVVSLAAPDVALRRVVTRLRADLAAGGQRVLPDGALRHALEDPLPPSASAPPLTRARALYDRARDAYAELDYETALARLAELDAIAVIAPPSARIVELLADRQLLAGLIHEGAGRSDAAREAFRAAHALAPARAALDPATYPPQVVSAYAAALAGAGEGGPLAVVGLPRGATVWLDGRPYAAGRMVRAGVHWIAARAPGHAPDGVFLRIDAGRPAAVTLAPRPVAAAARARELRADLIARPVDDDVVRAVAGELAALAAVRRLVLVRQGDERPEAATYDAARDTLGPFGSLDATRLTPAPAAAVVDGGSRGGASPPWYQTGWGRGLLIGGGVLVAGAAILAATTLGGDGGVTVGGFCLEGRPCE